MGPFISLVENLRRPCERIFNASDWLSVKRRNVSTARDVPSIKTSVLNSIEYGFVTPLVWTASRRRRTDGGDCGTAVGRRGPLRTNPNERNVGRGRDGTAAGCWARERGREVRRAREGAPRKSKLSHLEETAGGRALLGIASEQE